MLRAAVAYVALTGLLLIGIATRFGARPIYSYGELRCPEGLTAQPASVAAWAIVCRPDISSTVPGSIQWPRTAVVRHEVGLYLRNLNVRVFHIDFVAGTAHLLAWDIPAPGPDY